MTQPLTKPDVLHLAHLAKLTLSDEEIKKFQKQLSETLDYVKNLGEISTTKTVSASQDQPKNVFFNDQISDNRVLSTNESLANAKKKKDGYFTVDRIL